MESDSNSKLGQAIALRIAVRESIGRDEPYAQWMPLCNAADEAYDRLAPREAYIYRRWALDGFDMPGFLNQINDFMLELSGELN